MKEFARMNKEEWKVFSRTIRANKDKSSYFCGQVFDVNQWFLLYSGLKGYGVEISPLYEYKGSYIRCCRILYQLASDTQQRNQYLKDAKEWAANRKVEKKG